MDVLSFGRGVRFADVPAGGLFLGNKKGKSTVGIKIDDGSCVVLFPEKSEYKGPGLAKFTAWFDNDAVLSLDRLSFVLSYRPEDFAFGTSISVGEVIVSAEDHYLQIYNNNARAYVSLKSGTLTTDKAPLDPPWSVCGRWSLQFRDPQMTLVPPWVFGEHA